ncbi:hypothetical protein [Candidatus Nanohalococcus occultus]|uniref:Uncharacterized protein n=1 Tax=Candidatus Nanohalococcus occultus TaxID=2978047 RepID=A0ABY8CD68_9ARCH|nr:hypothetical protein SVXNc_0141 [Candidatus Nanohaloarchaeota archaeon SVXNc]
MRVKTHVYGFENEELQTEDFNSFKIYSVWSEPDIRVENDSIPMEVTDLEEKDDGEGAKRLVTAIEFGHMTGGYFFVERPKPSPSWITKVFGLLREEGWQGHYLNEMRVDCRGDIEIRNTEEYTAVIDRAAERVFHNRGTGDGAGKIENLSEFE